MGRQKSEVRSEKSEIGGQRSEVRNQNSEVQSEVINQFCILTSAFPLLTSAFSLRLKLDHLVVVAVRMDRLVELMEQIAPVPRQKINSANAALL